MIEIICMFEAYCDETGTHKGSHLTLVGGYLFTKTAAAAFSNRWTREVKPLLPSGVEVFHAVDCITGSRKFHDVRKDQREQIVRSLVEITKQTVSYGVIVGVEPTIYEKVKDSAIKRMAGTPYYLCLIRCAEYMSAWLDREKIEGDISYHFEAGAKHAGQAADFLKRIKANDALRQRCRLLDYAFPAKREEPCLQAADLLAWEWQRSYGTAMVPELSGRPWRLTLASLVEKPHQSELLTETSVGIRAMVNTISGLSRFARR